MTVFAQVAAKEVGDSVRQYTSSPSGDFVVSVLTIVVLLALVAVAWRLLLYRQERRRPLLLFHDLGDFHDIPRVLQRRLLRFARLHGVADPACLFVSPELVSRIQSLELQEAGSEKERRRIEEFFGDFTSAAFGDWEKSTITDGGAE